MRLNTLFTFALALTLIGCSADGLGPGNNPDGTVDDIDNPNDTETSDTFNGLQEDVFYRFAVGTEDAILVGSDDSEVTFDLADLSIAYIGRGGVAVMHDDEEITTITNAGIETYTMPWSPSRPKAIAMDSDGVTYGFFHQDGGAVYTTGTVDDLVYLFDKAEAIFTNSGSDGWLFFFGDTMVHGFNVETHEQFTREIGFDVDGHCDAFLMDEDEELFCVNNQRLLAVRNGEVIVDFSGDIRGFVSSAEGNNIASSGLDSLLMEVEVDVDVDTVEATLCVETDGHIEFLPSAPSGAYIVGIGQL